MGTDRITQNWPSGGPGRALSSADREASPVSLTLQQGAGSPPWRARAAPGEGARRWGAREGGEEAFPALPTTNKSQLNPGKSLIVAFWAGDRHFKHCFLWLECSAVFSLNSHIMFCKHLGSTYCLHRTYITKDTGTRGGHGRRGARRGSHRRSFSGSGPGGCRARREEVAPAAQTPPPAGTPPGWAWGRRAGLSPPRH